MQIPFDPTPYRHDTDRSWRWVRCYAILPVRTFDSGWIWLRSYWRWQCHWGWSFFDNFPYAEKPSPAAAVAAGTPSD